MKKVKIGTKITVGVALICLITLILSIYEFKKIKLYAIEAGEEYIPILIAVLTIFIIGIILAFCVSVISIKTINKHVEKLTEYSQKLARGEVGFEIKTEYTDEFTKVYEELAEIEASNSVQAGIAEAVAQGDLTVKSKPRCEGDLLGNSFVHLLRGNNEVLTDIKEASFQLTTGAEQVASASQALAQGSTEQASAIEQITASMDEIANMTKTNADHANQANEIVHGTKKGATLGNERMEQMKVAMNEINNSSERISKIIKVIDDISFQTNILALNAAVEAARAGVHGKGFAVVAEQIRELAGKSASAAAETAEMIDDSIRKVHNGTKLAEETADALSNIMENIDKIVEITSNIDKASNEQAVAVAQVDQAITQVSQVVQTNSATSEECAAAAEELSGQALSLRQAIGRYKLRENGNKSYGNVHRMDQESNSEDFSRKAESIISLDGDFGKY